MIAIIVRVLAKVVLVRTGGDGVEDGSPQATMLVLVVDAHRQEDLRFMPATLQRNHGELQIKLQKSFF